MHCLRWWLPIFLLPLPAASPFMMLLFVTTYAIRTKPCAYCSVIILGLMFSTCAFYQLQTEPEETISSSSTVAPSCWIDLPGILMLSPSLAKRRNTTGNGLGWWSAPTLRGFSTAVRERWPQGVPASIVKQQSLINRGKMTTTTTSTFPLWSYVKDALHNGIAIGYGDAQFRLKWLVD